MQCIGKSNALTRPRKSGESIHISYIGCEPNVSFGKSIKGTLVGMTANFVPIMYCGIALLSQCEQLNIPS